MKEALKLQEIMSQAQVFASAWSLVGGRFDGGNAMDDAEVAKNELRQMIAEALAQPEQEPVAWYIREKDMLTRDANWVAEYPDMCEPLYTTPPQRKPMTDEQFLELLLRKGTQELVGVTTFVGGSIQMQGKIGLLRSAKIIKEFVEAAHGIIKE